MYRESLTGLALAATLAEIQPPLTQRQEEEMWRIFDLAMEAAVAEAPLMSHLTVRTPLPSADGGGGYAAITAAAPPLHVPAASPPSTQEAAGTQPAPPPQTPAEEAAAPFDDSNIAFPVYRLVDKEWTLLLKDPTVEVRDEHGVTETIQLDYLRVRLHDLNASSGDTQKKATWSLWQR